MKHVAKWRKAKIQQILALFPKHEWIRSKELEKRAKANGISSATLHEYLRFLRPRGFVLKVEDIVRRKGGYRV
jgi:hypothetical protein